MTPWRTRKSKREPYVKSVEPTPTVTGWYPDVKVARTRNPQLRTDFIFASRSHADCRTAWLWTRRHFDPSKRRVPFVSIHVNCVTSENTRIFRNTALKPQIFQGAFYFNYDLGVMLWTRRHWILYICISRYGAPVLCSYWLLLERSLQVRVPIYCSLPPNLYKNVR